MPPESIVLEVPIGRDWEPVMRLVLGGIGDRLDLGFDELDDLQLAVERLLAEAGADTRVRLEVELSEGGLRARIGPLSEGPIADALQRPDTRPGELTLRRVLETVVDSFGVERSADEGLHVRLEKLVHRVQ